MAGTFELKGAASEQFMWNLKAGNHEVILTSELYKTKAAAQNGIESVRSNAGNDAQFDRKTAKDGQFYFTLKAGNGQVIGKSEMYKSEAGREKGIQSVKTNAANAAIKDLC